MSEKKEQQKFAFIEWLKKKENRPHSHLECPIKLHEYFKNLEDPIKYIQNEKIQHYKKQENELMEEIKKIKDNSQRFSKNINKKVINRDNTEYKFDINFNDIDRSGFENFEFKQKRQKDKKQNDAKFNLRIAEFERNYHHGTSSNFNEKKKIEEQAITMKAIKTIGTKEFQNYKNNEIYDIFHSEEKTKQKYGGGIHSLLDDDEIDKYCERVKFQMKDDEEYFSEKSQLVLFNPRQLKFWKKENTRKKANDIQILGRCRKVDRNNPSYNDFLDFSSERITGQILQQIVKLKKTHQKEQQLDKNNENLEEQYNKAKANLQFLRQYRKNNKTHRVSYKNDDKNAQTLQILNDKSFDSYFEEDTKQILIKLDELIEMRELLIQEKDLDKRKISLVNMYHEIRKYCFKLLAMIFKNEDFPQYYEFTQIEDKNIAEKMMLETIYKEFNRIKSPEVDGVKKSEILKRYLNERETNQKILQVLQLQNVK